MKVGIKFCGGCNSRYDRGVEVGKLKEDMQDVEWISGNDMEICDYWLIVCGCPRGCVNMKNLLAKKEILLLERPIDFKKAEEKMKKVKLRKKKNVKKVLHVGMKAFIKKQITKELVQSFARLTEDYNRIHTDAIFASEQWFQQPVAHGMLGASLLSTVMGMQLPGEGTILLEETSQFLKPMFFGDEITAEILLTGYQEEKRYYIGELRGTCRNQKNEIVVSMKAKQMMMKHLFEIKGE